MSCNFRDFFRYNQINAGIMEWGDWVKIKFSKEIIRAKIEKSKDINRLIFKFSKEIMDLFVADIGRIKVANKTFLWFPTILILVLTIVSSIAHYSQQHCWLQSAALPTIVGTPKKMCCRFQSFLSARSNTSDIGIVWGRLS